MKNYATCIWLLIYCLFNAHTAVFSQKADTIRILYDEDWKEIKDSSRAVFYRKGYKDAKGVWIACDYYMKNHQPQMIGPFTSDNFKVKEGFFTFYHDNGGREYEGIYTRGKAEGIWKRYDEEGRLLSEESFEHGDITKISIYYPNGKLYTAGQMSPKKGRVGWWKFWNVEGKLVTEGNYKNGSRDGVWTKYFANGKTMKRTFKEGEMEEKKTGIVSSNSID